MIIVLLSGKRYTGKTTFANELIKRWETLSKSLIYKMRIHALADKCKEMFANNNSLDYDKLLMNREYKEKYRKDLTIFYRKILEDDPITFEKFVMSDINNDKNNSIHIISDTRILSNITYFESMCSSRYVILKIRLEAKDEIRKMRGWVKTIYDDEPTETGLDDYSKWDHIISNENMKLMTNHIDDLCKMIELNLQNK